jgi:hypothetical protein
MLLAQQGHVTENIKATENMFFVDGGLTKMSSKTSESPLP